MSNQIQFKRGYSTQSYTPTAGEPYYIMDTNELRVGDGTTVKGVGWLSRPITNTYNLYVSPSGSYTASGLTPGNTTTLVGAIDKAAQLNWNGYNRVFILLADGMYTVSQSVNWTHAKNGPLVIQGNPSAPQNVILNSNFTQSWGGLLNASDGGFVHINGVSFQTTYADVATNYQVAIGAYTGSHVVAENVRFGGVFARHAQSGDESIITLLGSLGFYGKARDCALCTYRNSEIMIYNTNVTFTGNPVIPTFLVASECAAINNYNTTTFTGTATVTNKYTLTAFGSIRNASQYPGSATNITNMSIGLTL